MPALARFYPPVWQGKRNTSCRAPFPGLPGSSQPCSRRIFHTAALRLFYQGTRLRYTTPARVLRNSWRFWCGNWPGRRRPAGAVRRGHAPRREAGGGRRGRRLVFFGRWLLSPGQPRALLGNQRGGPGRGARDGAKVRCEIRDAPAGAGASDVGGVGGALPAVVRQRWRRAAGAAGAVRGVMLRVAAGRSGAAGAPSPRAASPRSRGSNTRDCRGQSSFRSRPKGSRRTLP